MSNVERLQDAKLIPTPNPLDAADTTKIDALSYDELSALISVKQQLGDDFVTKNIVRAANCFI